MRVRKIILVLIGLALRGQPPAGATSPGGTVVTDIAPGNQHTCALLEEQTPGAGGRVKCWGRNQAGQLGTNSQVDSPRPQPIYGISDGITAISTDFQHTCVVTTSGGVKCWGDNTYGQVGNGTGPNLWLGPVDVCASGSGFGCAGGAALTGVVAVATGDRHTCALVTTGGVKCWGNNFFGQLGNGESGDGTDKSLPVDVPGLTGVASISAGGLNTCAITTSRVLKCWGNDFSGELGIGSFPGAPLGSGETCPNAIQDNAKCISVPVKVPGVGDVTAVDTGQTTCALTTGGGVKCWGYNGNGEVGNGTKVPMSSSNPGYSQPTPVAVLTAPDGAPLAGVTAIAGSCALIGGGSVKCWGENFYGRLGDGTTTDRPTAVDVVGLASGVAAIGAGGAHDCALMVTGKVKCWGLNNFGQLGAPTGICRQETFFPAPCSPVPVDVRFGFVVTSTGDEPDADPNDGVCDTDPLTPGDQCTLRAAIEQANATPGEDTIEFAIDGAPPAVIAPQVALPEITDPLVIDATTQPGYAGKPVVALVGDNARGVDGLVITAGDSIVRGLTIVGSFSDGVVLRGKGGSLVEGNFVGVDPGAGVFVGYGRGIVIDSSNDNVIGGTSEAARNIVSGNANNGIRIEEGSSGNVVEGNYVGTNADGTDAIANGAGGIVIIDSPGNFIGGAEGTTFPGPCTGACNLISGNRTGGVGLFALTDSTSTSGNVVRGNFIGTNAAGSAALPNTRAGIGFFNASGNVIGGAGAGSRSGHWRGEPHLGQRCGRRRLRWRRCGIHAQRQRRQRAVRQLHRHGCHGHACPSQRRRWSRGLDRKRAQQDWGQEP